MKAFTSALSWMKSQFKLHKWRSLIVTGLTLGVATTGVLWATGVFSRDQEETFSYLPNRAYVLAPTEPAEPQTLADLLHADAPEVDTLLRKPEIAQTLIQAQTLTDVVDSRFALNNLRELDRQLTERLKEKPDDFAVIDLNQVKMDIVSGQDELPADPVDAVRLSALSILKPLSSVVRLASSLPTRTALASQSKTVSEMKSATSRLLKSASDDKLSRINPDVNIKTVWEKTNEGLVHLVPSGDWLPEQGYKLYRVVDGSRTLLEEQLAAPSRGLSGALNVKESDKVRQLYEQAALTPTKLSMLNMDVSQFNELAYQTSASPPTIRVQGELDFLRMREEMITISANFEQRIPETDLLIGQPIYVMGRQDNGLYAASAAKTAFMKKYSVVQPAETIVERSWSIQMGSAIRTNTVRSIVTARQQLATLSFVDSDFAQEAGFLFRDNLSLLNLPDGKKVSYQVETQNGITATQEITIGRETALSQPQGLMGYGLDAKVPIRWQAVTNPAEKKIVSGYWIERKLGSESDFRVINEEPVVISYMLDETNVFFESPVFFEDSVANGQTAEYRIQSFDVFGRKSPYSEPITVTVEKVTPPNAPGIDKPELSTDVTNPSSAVSEAISANSGKKGIILPIYTDSPDTVRFTVYRAVALGAQSFGPPEVLADLTYHNPRSDESDPANINTRPTGFPQATPSLEEVTKNKAKHLVRTDATPSYPNLIYFDAQIEEGHTYKYWVSAWDSWNNESAWSKSASLGVPSDVKPKIPASLNIAMLSRELPDFSGTPPGIVKEDPIAKADLAELAASPARSYATDVNTVKQADSSGVTIGQFQTDAALYSVISLQFDNLPEDKYIHMFVAVRGEDVLADGTARLRWPAYSGDGLDGYVVYLPQFPLLTLEQMQLMTRDELMALGNWRRVNEQPVTDNQLVIGGLSQTPGSFSLYLICLEPEKPSAPAPVPTDVDPTSTSRNRIVSHFSNMLEGGHVTVEWEAPDDPQIKFYRVYRSEVASFKKPIDESTLEWTMVGDMVKAPKYTERVEQTFAHYYYYKVTSVTPWGVESDVGVVQRFRVPATKPPQTPNLLMPLSRKDGVQINFSSVSHCDRYIVYRTEVPRLTEIQFNNFKTGNAALVSALFDNPSEQDSYLSGLINRSRQTSSSILSTRSPIQAISKFKTVSPLSSDRIVSNINALGDQQALSSYKQILQEFGPLAMADYRDLSLDMLFLINWTQVGILPVDEDTVEEVGPLGLLKPLSIIDKTAVYGKIYLYTVQAWNDDNLGSTRPEPVEASPRRNRPFDPITGLKSESVAGPPKLSWDTPTMPNLNWEQCREDTVGYVVYRSDTEDGTYFQASPLLLEPEWTDNEADPYAYNWYKVKVLDTGGYLSEFSEPLLIRRLYIPQASPIIPADVLVPVLNAPVITLPGTRFEVAQGTAFKTTYQVSGTQPITVTLKAVDQKGTSVRGFTLDTVNMTVTAANTLAAGAYTVTLKAVNSVGEGTASFILNVLAPKPTVTPTPKPTTAPTPTLTPRPTATPTPVIVKPTVILEASTFKIAYGTDFKASYTLTGTQPIQLTLLVTKPLATGAGSVPVEGFTIDQKNKTINAIKPAAGTYTGLLTATNSAGKSEARFTLTVEVLTPPTIVDGNDRYWSITVNNLVTTSYTKQVSATGSTPITWSLVKSTNNFGYTLVTWDIPRGISINSTTGLLTIRQSTLSAGYYVFVIQATNGTGNDRQYVVLRVTSMKISLPPSQGLNDPVFLPSGPGNTSGFTFLSSTTPPTPTPPSDVNVERFTSDKVKCLNFYLSQVDVTRPAVWDTALTGRPGYTGTALMDIGYQDPIPVHIKNADFVNVSGEDRMKLGTVYLTEPVELKEVGVTLTSLDVTPQFEKSLVNGFVKNRQEDRNLIGNLSMLEFTEARLQTANIVVRTHLPAIQYQQLRIYDFSEFWIRLDTLQTGEPDFLRLVGSKVAMKSHLETLSNEGLNLTPTGNLTFNIDGRMSGTIATTSDQTLQLLVPGGTALRVADASLTYTFEAEDPKGHLVGKLILPFEKGRDFIIQASKPNTGTHPKSNAMDQLSTVTPSTVTPSLKVTLQKSLVQFGETIQQNGLRVVPTDPIILDRCGYAVINVQDWNGKGFLMESSIMTPTQVSDRTLSEELQKIQAITVAPTAVTIDLDREHSFPKLQETQTPNETEMPFWVGMVMKGGTLTLPPAFVKTADGKPVVFNLAEGEMIYDLNGFNYQTFLYSPTGVPAQFGDALGGFEQVMVYNCLLDLYANRVNLEINADVRVDLFLNNWVKVKLYTNKEDNADGEAGQFLCSVAPTTFEKGLGDGIGVKIDGGWLKPDGMHVSGALTIATDEVMASEPLAFTDLIVPADQKETHFVLDTEDYFGSSELDKPVNIDFQGFLMEIRALDLQFTQTPQVVPRPGGAVRVVLKGSTLLSDNIPLSNETTDDLIIECPKSPGLPTVFHEDSQSVLTANFEGCVDVTGVLVPKQTATGQMRSAQGRQQAALLGPVFAGELVSSPGEGLVEFDTDQLSLGLLGQLNALDVEAITRFGYDMNNNRCYFAVGLIPATEDGAINFGAGDVKDFTGVVVYNMLMGRTDDNKFDFPDDPAQMEAYVENRPVHTGADTFFGAGIKGVISISGMCEIRELYFGFDSGPIVDASGGLWLPLDVAGMMAGDGFKKVGSVAITYSHPERYFSFSITIDNIDLIACTVGGSIGFEFSPHLFGVYLGYPETLAGSLGIFRVGLGVGFRVDTEDSSFIKAKIEFGFDKSAEFAIVYLRGYLYVGADGMIYLSGDDAGLFILELYLKGGIEGGIIVAGDHYNIISFYLDARGKLTANPNDKWELACSCTVSYSLDLWLFSVEGSVSASFDTTF